MHECAVCMYVCMYVSVFGCGYFYPLSFNAVVYCIKNQKKNKKQNSDSGTTNHKTFKDNQSYSYIAAPSPRPQQGIALFSQLHLTFTKNQRCLWSELSDNTQSLIWWDRVCHFANICHPSICTHTRTNTHLHTLMACMCIYH